MGDFLPPNHVDAQRRKHRAYLEALLPLVNHHARAAALCCCGYILGPDGLTPAPHGPGCPVARANAAVPLSGFRPDMGTDHTIAWAG